MIRDTWSYESHIRSITTRGWSQEVIWDARKLAKSPYTKDPERFETEYLNSMSEIESLLPIMGRYRKLSNSASIALLLVWKRGDGSICGVHLPGEIIREIVEWVHFPVAAMKELMGGLRIRAAVFSTAFQLKCCMEHILQDKTVAAKSSAESAASAYRGLQTTVAENNAGDTKSLKFIEDNYARTIAQCVENGWWK